MTLDSCSCVWFCLGVSCSWFACLCIVSCVICFDFSMPHCVLQVSPMFFPLSAVLFPPCFLLCAPPPRYLTWPPPSPLSSPVPCLIVSVCVLSLCFPSCLCIFIASVCIRFCSCSCHVLPVSPCFFFWDFDSCILHFSFELYFWFLLCLLICTL